MPSRQRTCLRLAGLLAVAGLCACSQPNDPAKLWTGRAPDVKAVGMHGGAPAAVAAPTEGVRTVASFDVAASAPVGTLVAR